MTFYWTGLVFLCCILNCLDCVAPSPAVQRNKYEISFRLTRSTRTHVQQLLKRYKAQQLGNSHFEDRSRQLKCLPQLSVDFYSWKELTDWEHLHAAFRDLQVYWNMLELKKIQLNTEERGQRMIQTNLSKSIKHIQLDLRDLMNQVSSQMNYVNNSWTKPTTPVVQTCLNPETQANTVWDRRVEGYIILRDLDLYLIKLARSFLQLVSELPKL